MCFKKVWNRRKLFRFDQLSNLLKGCILNKSIPILYFALEKIALRVKETQYQTCLFMINSNVILFVLIKTEN